MARTFRLIVSVACLALLAACSPYVDDYQFVPHPALLDIPSIQPDAAPMVSAMATIVGVHRRDNNEGIPPSVEVRLRLDNGGLEAVVFDPQSLTLTNSLLWRFPPPILEPPQSVVLAPMQAIVVVAYFPFPPDRSWDDTDLESLQLRWSIRIGNRRSAQIAMFHRIAPVYYDDYPYWYYSPYPVGFYGGVVFVHHR
jgi:hypothetical protein